MSNKLKKRFLRKNVWDAIMLTICVFLFSEECHSISPWTASLCCNEFVHGVHDLPPRATKSWLYPTYNTCVCLCLCLFYAQNR